MVGLAAIAEFTNGMEAVLDRIRSGALAVDSDIITTLLEARDQLAAMVEAEANHAPIAAPTELAQRLVGLLREIKPEPASAAPRQAPPVAPTPPADPPELQRKPPARTPTPPPAAREEATAKTRPRGKRPRKTSVPEDTAADSAGGPPGYRITFRPGPDVLRRGGNPIGVLDELRDLGPTRVATDPDAVPTLDEIDPERCYLGWRIEIETDASAERLDDVFLFMAEDSELVIERRLASGAYETLRGAELTTASATPIEIPRPEPLLATSSHAREIVREATAIATTTPIPAAPPLLIPPPDSHRDRGDGNGPRAAGAADSRGCEPA